MPQGTGIVKFGNLVLPFDARIPVEYMEGVLGKIIRTDKVGRSSAKLHEVV